MATLLILMALRLAGNQVVSALAKTDTVEPAVQAVWDTISDGLRERASFILVVGLGFVAAGLLAGPGRYATTARRWLAPHLREHPAAAYVAVAALFLLWLAFIPGINNAGQVLTILLLAVLAVVGVEALRGRPRASSRAERLLTSGDRRFHIGRIGRYQSGTTRPSKTLWAPPHTLWDGPKRSAQQLPERVLAWTAVAAVPAGAAV